MICLLAVSERAQRFNHGVLFFGLPRIDHVIDFSVIAKMRMVERPNRGRNPAIVPVGIFVELAITEVAAQQSEFPKMVGDVFPGISHGAVRANDDLLILLSDFLCVLCGLRGFSLFPRAPHDPAAFIFAFGLEVEHAGILQFGESSVPKVQMENFALTRQEVVLDIQPVHGLKMPPQNRDGDYISYRRRLIFALFDCVQHLLAGR